MYVCMYVCCMHVCLYSMCPAYVSTICIYIYIHTIYIYIVMHAYKQRWIFVSVVFFRTFSISESFISTKPESLNPLAPNPGSENVCDSAFQGSKSLNRLWLGDYTPNPKCWLHRQGSSFGRCSSSTIARWMSACFGNHALQLRAPKRQTLAAKSPTLNPEV